MVTCLEQGADLHMAQLMPLPLTVSCFSKIQSGFTFLVPAHLGSPGKRAVKRMCVCVSTVGGQYASSCQISSKSVKWLQRYGELTVLKMAAVRYLGFVKFEFFNGRSG